MLCLRTRQRGTAYAKARRWECVVPSCRGLGGGAAAPLQGAAWTRVKGLGLIQRGWWEALICFFKTHWKKMMRVISKCHVWLFATPWTVARQASLPLGMLQARILEWVAIPFSRRSSRPWDRAQVSRIAGRFFTDWATREAQVTQHLT